MQQREPLPGSPGLGEAVGPWTRLGSAVGETRALLALASLRGVGYWTLYNMARDGVRFGDVLDASSREEAVEVLRRFGARLETAGADWATSREQALERAERTGRALDSAGVQLLLSAHPDFPASLNDLPDPPAWLFVRGDVRILGAASLAVVGTRTPSEDGLWLANSVGASLGFFGVPTVSGLANGIDQLVHTWSLRMGVPTIAVLGTGIFTEYPKGSAALAARIVGGGGALVTEYLPRDSYSGENFVRRNRLQAALGRALVPVEWAARSGTAHTVRFATVLRRPIAGLRLPDWPRDRVLFTNGSAEIGTVFTLPGEEAEFRTFVSGALQGQRLGRARDAQLSLFEA